MDNQKKKILFIAPSPLYLEKGSSLRMYSILKILSEYYKIDLVTYSLGRKFKLDNVNVYRTAKWFKPKLSVGKPTISKLILDFLMLLKAIRLSLFNNYNIIHCEDFEGLGIGVLIKFLNKKSKLVYDLHNRFLDNLYLKQSKSKLELAFLWIEKIFVNKSDKIILNWGKYLKDNFFKEKKKFLYYDPLDIKIKEKILPAKKYIVYSGNFEEYQGLQNFIPIFCKIKTDIKLVLIGKSSSKIEKLIKDLKADDRIILTGRLSIDESNFLIKNSMAGILPRIEGSSMKVVHYYFCNKPVIATSTMSNQELIKDGVNGYLYSSDKELEEKLIMILDESITKNFSGEIKKTKNYILNIWDKNKFIKEYEK